MFQHRLGMYVPVCCQILSQKKIVSGYWDRATPFPAWPLWHPSVGDGTGQSFRKSVVSSEYIIHLVHLTECAALTSCRFEITHDDERAFQGHFFF